MLPDIVNLADEDETNEANCRDLEVTFETLFDVVAMTSSVKSGGGTPEVTVQYNIYRFEDPVGAGKAVSSEVTLSYFDKNTGPTTIPTPDLPKTFYEQQTQYTYAEMMAYETNINALETLSSQQEAVHIPSAPMQKQLLMHATVSGTPEGASAVEGVSSATGTEAAPSDIDVVVETPIPELNVGEKIGC